MEREMAALMPNPVVNRTGLHRKKSPQQFYKEQLEYKERVESDIEFKRFMEEIEIKRRC